MYTLPSEIIEYISQFNTVSEQVNLKLVCCKYNKAINADMRNRAFYKCVRNAVNEYSKEGGEYKYYLVLVKWRPDAVYDQAHDYKFGATNAHSCKRIGHICICNV